MDINIRKADIKDLESIMVLFDKLSLSDLPYDTEVDVYWAHTPDGKNYFTDKIQGKNSVCFVAEADGSIVGYFLAIKKEDPTYRLIKIADLEHLVVDENYRNQGIGKKLMNAFISWAKSEGINKVSVNVFTDNEKGIKFYKREGFLPFESILEKKVD